jgi:hypothetical protein
LHVEPSAIALPPTLFWSKTIALVLQAQAIGDRAGGVDAIEDAGRIGIGVFVGVNELIEALEQIEMDPQIAAVDRVDLVDHSGDRGESRGHRTTVRRGELAGRRRRQPIDGVLVRPGVGRRCRIRVIRGLWLKVEVARHARHRLLKRILLVGEAEVAVRPFPVGPDHDRLLGSEHESVEPRRAQIEPRRRTEIVQSSGLIGADAVLLRHPRRQDGRFENAEPRERPVGQRKLDVDLASARGLGSLARGQREGARQGGAVELELPWGVRQLLPRRGTLVRGGRRRDQEQERADDDGVTTVHGVPL